MSTARKTSGPLRWLGRSISHEQLVSQHQFNRIVSMERNIGLPLRAGLMLAAIYYIRLSKEFTGPLWSNSELIADFFGGAMVAYVVLNIVASVTLFFMARAEWRWMRWGVFTIGLVDAFFLALATLAAGGYDSGLYWAFLGVIVRNAFSLPVAALQLILNFAVCGMYGIVGWVEYVLRRDEATVVPATLDSGVELWSPGEDFALRIVILVLVTICGYGLQVFYDRRIVQDAENQELTLRTEQLHAAGRLAAEIAHQLKNPLSIINNSAFNLQKRLAPENERQRAQLGIIRDEVARCDQIISELMGYSQLAEAKVERIPPELLLDAAIARVFPDPGVGNIAISRDYEQGLPAMLVQRQQVEEAVVNMLANAREVVNDSGNVGVAARWQAGRGIIITISDDGPGIPEDQLKRVFEAYFTTKQKGTGLGLAIARSAIELHGGTLSVESAPGRGTRFVLELPLQNPAKSKD